MPIIHAYMWEGVDDESAQKIIAGITRVFTELGIPAEAVRIIIQEVSKSRWGIAGQLASERPVETEKKGP
ncbi:MAG: tautomerase family protein [Candidatus Aminicenantales bacterium]